MRKARVLVPLTLLGLLIGLAACGSSNDSSSSGGSTSAGGGSKEPIVIGGALALTGGFSAYDLQNRVGSEIAIDDINGKGGVLGRPLKYVVEDTKSDLSVAPGVASDLLSKGAKAMIVQCDFDFGAPAALVAQEKNVPSFSCASSPKFGVQGVGPAAYDVSPPSNEFGAGIAETAYNRLKARNAYVLTDTSLAYSKDECSSFQNAWKQLPDAKTAGTATFVNSDTSVQAQVTKMNSANPKPDVIIVCSYLPGGPNVIRQIRAAGIKTPIISGGGMDSRGAYSAIKGLSDYYILTYGSINGDDPRPEVNRLFQEFEKRNGKPASVAYPILSYTEVQLAAAAMKKAGSTDGPALIKALDSFKDEPTLAGPVTYTPDKHYSYLPVAVTEYVNGEQKFVQLFTPKNIPDLPL